jgi:hypothetical protein
MTLLQPHKVKFWNGRRKGWHLLSSMPMRNAASANDAYRLPVPESGPVTAYSLTNACKGTADVDSSKMLKNEVVLTQPQSAHSGRSIHLENSSGHTFGPLLEVASNWCRIAKRFLALV